MTGWWRGAVVACWALALPRWMGAQSAGDAGGVERMAPADTVAQVSQRATAEDMRVFDPYIGTFRSRVYHDSARGQDRRYQIQYRWFDATKTIVKFRISTRYQDGTESLTAEGFYGYDPFRQQLYVVAAFSWGMSGFGTVGEFDRESYRRVTWARSQGADGVTTYVRDAFEVVDANRFNDVTLVRQGDDGPWQVVYRDSFTRVGEPHED